MRLRAVGLHDGILRSFPRALDHAPTRAVPAVRSHPLVGGAPLHCGLDENFPAHPPVVSPPGREDGDATRRIFARVIVVLQ